ncbi:MAG: WD40 repeat domain-containing protein [Spirochaetes bacterium]|nr:WD40 repeat domain-containing protein [Spirochaetota bacterium]
MKKITPLNKFTLENGDSFFSIEIKKDHVVTCSGKINTEGKEKINTPKSDFEKDNIQFFANKLTWKKYKEGYFYSAADNKPLRLQIPTPEHLKGVIYAVIDNNIFLVQDSDNNGSRIWKINSENGSHEKIFEMKSFMIRSIKYIPGTQKLLITPDFDRKIELQILDAESGKTEKIAESTYLSYHDILDVDSSGEKVVFGKTNDVFCIINLHSGKSVFEAPVLNTGTDGQLTKLSDNGKYCAVAGRTPDGNILRIYDLDKNIHFETVTGSDNPVDDMAWAGDKIILFERFNPPGLWKINSGSVELTGIKFISSGMSIAVSSDNKFLAVYDNGVNVAISEIESGLKVAEIFEPLHLKYGNACFLPNDRIMVTGGGIISVYKLK